MCVWEPHWSHTFYYWLSSNVKNSFNIYSSLSFLFDSCTFKQKKDNWLTDSEGNYLNYLPVHCGDSDMSTNPNKPVCSRFLSLSLSLCLIYWSPPLEVLKHCDHLFDKQSLIPSLHLQPVNSGHTKKGQRMSRMWWRRLDCTETCLINLIYPHFKYLRVVIVIRQ